MPNNLLIYVIVALNAACHPMLIWRLKLDKPTKWKFSAMAVAAPVLVMCAMRLLVAVGVMHGRVADQATMERAITSAASMLLIVGPVMATAAAIIFSRKQRSAMAQPS
jgi:hypothetical protein